MFVTVWDVSLRIGFATHDIDKTATSLSWGGGGGSGGAMVLGKLPVPGRPSIRVR